MKGMSLINSLLPSIAGKFKRNLKELALNLKRMGIKGICRRYPSLVISLGAFVLTILLIFTFLHNQRGVKLTFFFLYMTAACTFFPLPTPQIVIKYGELFNPFLVAIIGGIGTTLGTLIDYGLFSFAFRYEKVNRINKTRIYQYSVRFFQKIAFISLVVAGFTPIPFDPFRFLAISMKYSKIKYVLAVFISRSLRYFLLAKVGEEYGIPDSILWGSLALMIVAALVREIFKKLKSRNIKIDMPKQTRREE